MPIIAPGYDFGTNEEVTRQKLIQWAGGITATTLLDATALGLAFASISYAATEYSAASEGEMFVSISTGHAMINTRHGFVPVFGTKGALFSKRVRDSAGAWNVARAYHGAHSGAMAYNSNAATFGITEYSLSHHLDNFGDSVHGAGMVSEGYGDLFGILRGANLTPSLNDHLVAGGLSTSSCATEARRLYGWGGVLPWFATSTGSNQTYPRLQVSAKRWTHGATGYLAYSYLAEFGIAARNGSAYGTSDEVHLGAVYPHWAYNVATNKVRLL